MPHQCVRCKALYDDGAKEILKGCPCGCKMFFFIKKERFKELQEEEVKLSKKERVQIEEDIYDLVGSEIDKNKPIVLDFESIRVMKPGQYELDNVSLCKDDPLIFRLEEGKYMIDIAASFQALSSHGKGKK
jgi:predicted  nucleic acid-binding Zn-ribbon protein